MKNLAITPIILLILTTISVLGCGGDGGACPVGETSSGKYMSNGEQIYFTSRSMRGNPISSTGGVMMHGTHWSCADCHGADGKGRRIDMMMYSFTAPDIRYHVLTDEHHHDDDHSDEDEHPAYSHETIKRAIAKGLDPAGNALDPEMPRWQIADEDMEDLLEYLKVL